MAEIVLPCQSVEMHIYAFIWQNHLELQLRLKWNGFLFLNPWLSWNISEQCGSPAKAQTNSMAAVSVKHYCTVRKGCNMMDWELLLIFSPRCMKPKTWLPFHWRKLWKPPRASNLYKLSKLSYRISYSLVQALEFCAKPHWVKAIRSMQNLIKQSCCDLVQTKDVLCVDINKDDAVIRNYGRFANESVQTSLFSELNKWVDSRIGINIYNLDKLPLF